MPVARKTAAKKKLPRIELWVRAECGGNAGCGNWTSLPARSTPETARCGKCRRVLHIDAKSVGKLTQEYTRR